MGTFENFLKWDFLKERLLKVRVRPDNLEILLAEWVSGFLLFYLLTNDGNLGLIIFRLLSALSAFSNVPPLNHFTQLLALSENLTDEVINICLISPPTLSS